MQSNERKMQISSLSAGNESDEPHHEKTGFLPMGKQRRRSAVQLHGLYFCYTKSDIHSPVKSEISSF